MNLIVDVEWSTSTFRYGNFSFAGRFEVPYDLLELRMRLELFGGQLRPMERSG